jgi:FAD:protein FMN transferase
MATRFELLLHGNDPILLQAAADEALNEIERLNDQLSLYLPASEISHINAHAANRPVPVEPRLFQLLLLAKELHAGTEGAFDPTIAPLTRCWGFMGASGALPLPEAVAAARAQVGFQHVILDEQRSTIQFARQGMMLDLGSIGKGYALEQAVEILLEAQVSSALVHGGTSTVCAIGSPPGADAWNIALDKPPDKENDDNARPLTVVALKDEAMSVSAGHGKFFAAQGKTYGHVLDPRSGQPAQGAALAAVALPSATESDALSTALLVLGMAGQEIIARLRPRIRSFVLEYDPDGNPMISDRKMQS